MATRKKKEDVPQGVAVIVPTKKELILEGAPEQQLEFAHKAAKALMNWVEQKPGKVMIRGEQYLEFGDWQILGRFYGATVGIEWTKPLPAPLKGYEARATVLRNGEVISSAEAMCTRDESNWRTRDEFMLKSMAQTRASAKALRQAFGWVAELAGMKSTPAEEMDGIARESNTRTVVRKQYSEDEPEPLDFTDAGVPTGATPTPKASTIDEQRLQIKDLLDENSATLLVTKEDYVAACDRLTGFPLTPENYTDIITILTENHGPKD